MHDHQLALKPGYVLEHFRIERVLGKGGFGITYLAVDVRLGKKVAIKELLPDSIATRVEGSTVLPQSSSQQEDWQWAKERFVEEARMLAGFSHPAIVGVHLLIEANGTAYMVMDYLEGESYEARLKRIGTESDEASVMAVIGPVLEGLEQVHQRGLLHRDIKPDNILIKKNGQPVLIDFGAARESVGKTVTMTSIVSHGYSPIEQYQSKGKMGPWTDIYAVGAVMCRAITGEKPPVAADRVMDDEFEWLSYRELPHFTEQFRQAVDWGLRVKPQDRPQDTRQFQLGLVSDRSGDPPFLDVSRALRSPARPTLFSEAGNETSADQVSSLDMPTRPLPWLPIKITFAALALFAVLSGLFFAKFDWKTAEATSPATLQASVIPQAVDGSGVGGMSSGGAESPEQLYRQGVAYLRGEGVPKDENKGLELLTRAGEMGSASAQLLLGQRYWNKLGQQKESVRWFRKAADQGNADAQKKLGHMYEVLPVRGGPSISGDMEADDAEAARWYRKAAEQGDPEAQYRLGLMYELGRILKLTGTDLVAWTAQCEAAARPWYEKAAAQGHAEAINKLQ